jgi:hypothetical protein
MFVPILKLKSRTASRSQGIRESGYQSLQAYLQGTL